MIRDLKPFGFQSVLPSKQDLACKKRGDAKCLNPTSHGRKTKVCTSGPQYDEAKEQKWVSWVSWMACDIK